MKKITFFLLLVLMLGCTAKSTYTSSVSSNSYAQGFEISEATDYIKVRCLSPWQQGATLMTYYLVRHDSILTPADGVRILIPVRRIATTSCTHIGFLSELGCIESVCGVCNPDIVYDSEIGRMVKEGKISNLGDAMTPNVELIVESNPEAVMVSTFAQGDKVTEQLLKLGMPVIYNNEWTESEPLARAEWIRYVAAFYDRLPEADSIFKTVENKYNELKNKAATIDNKRSIMSGNNFRGTWYVPAGKTYMGALFADAGARYCYQDDPSAFSIALTVETVISKFSEADVWVGSSANSMDELRLIDEKHTWFKAYKNNEVYNFNRRTTATGGNDFWESGVVHPERILNDLVLVLYKNKADNADFVYTNHLE